MVKDKEYGWYKSKDIPTDTKSVSEMILSCPTKYSLYKHTLVKYFNAKTYYGVSSTSKFHSTYRHIINSLIGSGVDIEVDEDGRVDCGWINAPDELEKAYYLNG